MQSYRKCPNCGTVNLNRDYCKECGELINTILSRQLEQKKRLAEKKEAKAKQKRDAKPSFLKRAKKHPSPIVRLMARALYSVWILVLLIGGILALIFAYIAA
jgi:transcription initiation factor TFIIIB Brf1 subunit/transcription initiation factor TFIIB